MSGNNAPQPSASGPAEVFDSTIAPSEGQVSQDAMPGGNTIEAPVHTGQANGIDPYFYAQFMSLVSFVWDITASPGQLLWSVPIHPTFVHQFMGHLTKMYNAYAGGFDFAVSIAGTGFHAGKLIVVRLPPNIEPSSLKRASDITAFPYFVIDPKTLEVVIKSAMDQRNVLYHYLPFDVENINSFGGFLAVYVLLPLSTSATGQSQVSVQVFTKPSQDFQFTQIRPIVSEIINPFVPSDLEKAMDFRFARTNPFILSNITEIITHSGKDVKLLSAELTNCVKINGEPAQNKLITRLPHYLQLEKTNFNQIKSYAMRLEKIENQIAAYPIGDVVYLAPIEEVSVFSFDKYTLQPDEDAEFAQSVPFTGKVLAGVNIFTANSKNQVNVQEWFNVRRRLPDDPVDALEWVFAPTKELEAAIVTPGVFESGFIDNLIQGGHAAWTVQLNNEIKFDIDYKEYAPPLKESIVTFKTIVGEVAQPYELTEALLQADYGNIISPSQSLVFELIDSEVELPLAPFRLHYNGYFTTMYTESINIKKLFNPKKYYFKFIGILPETTSLVSNKLPLQSKAAYIRNQVVSALTSQ